MDEPVRTEIDPQIGIGTVVLSQPEQRNPLYTTMMRAVSSALRALSADPAVRVVVVAAEGPVFSAGHDLSEMVGRTLDDEREIFDACVEMMNTVQQIPQPVIAAVQGPAIAAEFKAMVADYIETRWGRSPAG